MTNEAPSRRAIMPGIVVTVAGGAVGYVVASNSDAAKPAATPARSGTPAGADTAAGGTGGGTSALARVDDVPADGGMIVDGAGIVLTRNAAGTVQGFSTVCTHKGCNVNAVSDGKIRCPCHGSAFDTRTGQPVAGPAKAPLPSVPVTVRGGEVFPA
ncbi:Cytochrome bc1 complex Rieske iron-sulfur subunit [Frankia sp. AiPs1]|uniref:Rieske (2Fe-2S) protein n=1 Tax=Frankia sp. AiPa1 TaxID=573492 RepID=UPI00202B8D46|nr:Rieske (2Fe-2S) protein [Frankia sp. AiPa1]MCL9761049.1 Rieske (2Fe-2S) protein [Frankia sp. AiPa1]